MPQKIIANGTYVPGLFDPSSKQQICLCCGLSFSKWKSLEYHLEHAGCGIILLEEMLVEQEILLEERHAKNNCR